MHFPKVKISRSKGILLRRGTSGDTGLVAFPKNQTGAQRQRVRFGKEEQRRKRALTFEKSRSKRYKACSDVVGHQGLEPRTDRL